MSDVTALLFSNRSPRRQNPDDEEVDLPSLTGKNVHSPVVYKSSLPTSLTVCRCFLCDITTRRWLNARVFLERIIVCDIAHPKASHDHLPGCCAMEREIVSLLFLVANLTIPLLLVFEGSADLGLEIAFTSNEMRSRCSLGGGSSVI